MSAQRVPALACLCVLAWSAGGAEAEAQTQSMTQYSANPFIMRLDIPAPQDSAGGLLVADLDGDTLVDYLVSVPGHVAAHANDGSGLWTVQADIRVGGSAEAVGLPGHHGPGLQAADVDGDGRCEVLFLTHNGDLHVLDGSNGKTKRVAKPRLVPGAKCWEHVIVANLRGLGDTDLVFQACPQSGPDSRRGLKRGRLMAAFAFEHLDGEPLWQTDCYWGPAHGTARVADLDGDGRDEIAGVTVIDHDGAFVEGWRYGDKWNPKREGSFHLDSVFIADVRPELPGLEVVLLEEGANHVSLVSMEQFIWRVDYQRREPQNAAVGDFDRGRAGLEIWCRSRYDVHQKPFIFDARGALISHYEMDSVAPRGWTPEGVETIWTVDWTGGPKQLAAAKERHKSGDVAIFDPLTGRFVEHFAEKADRLYVADVSGDWREELVVLSGDEIHVYHNAEPNPNPDRPRLWTLQHYRRSKMTWNYYSP